MNAVVFDQSVSFCLLVLVFGGPDHKISDSRKGVGELVAGMTLTSISMRPAAAPPTVMSKNTVGFGMIDLFVLVSGGVGWSLSVAALRLFSGGCTRTPHPKGKGGWRIVLLFFPTEASSFVFSGPHNGKSTQAASPSKTKRFFCPPFFSPTENHPLKSRGGGKILAAAIFPPDRDRSR